MATVTSVTKHFPVPKEGFTTTAASTIGSGAATVPLNSVTGYVNGDTAVMVIDPGDATKKQAFTGVVDTAGVQLTGVVWTEGTNTSHAAGATVVDYVAATHMAMVTKGLLRDHNQSGYHKTLNDDNGNEWVKQTSVASAVNEITVANAITATPPQVSATGNDTNINLRIAGKGTGKAHVDGFMEIANDFVVSGLVWSGDSYGVNRNGSMTVGFVYINGQRSEQIPVVTARTFTASKDTYIDILNTAGVFSIVYTEVANNAASPALAANSLRLGIVVTAAGSIAAVGSINQGQDGIVLPIASSIPYAINDSLGNRICRRNPTESRRGFATKSSLGDVIPNAYTTYLSITTKTLGRSVEIQYGCNVRDGSSGANRSGHIRVVVDGVNSGDIPWLTNVNGGAGNAHNIFSHTPAAGAHTYVLQVEADTGAASLLDQAYLRIEEP